MRLSLLFSVSAKASVKCCALCSCVSSTFVCVCVFLGVGGGGVHSNIYILNVGFFMVKEKMCVFVSIFSFNIKS